MAINTTGSRPRSGLAGDAPETVHIRSFTWTWLLLRGMQQTSKKGTTNMSTRPSLSRCLGSRQAPTPSSDFLTQMSQPSPSDPLRRRDLLHLEPYDAGFSGRRSQSQGSSSQNRLQHQEGLSDRRRVLARLRFLSGWRCL